MNRHACIQARLAIAAVAELLESRTQAQQAWTRKTLQKELQRIGYYCSMRSIARYVNVIRAGARMLAHSSGDEDSEPKV